MKLYGLNTPRRNKLTKICSTMDGLLIALLLVTSSVAKALSTDSGLDSGQFTHECTVVDVYKVNTSSVDHQFAPANGTLFDPNPACVPIGRVCIARDMPACAFGAEDGTWILATNDTNAGCVEMSPPLVLNNGFCCFSLDDCALLDSPFALQGRESPLSSHLTPLTLTSSNNGEHTMEVHSDGTPFSFNTENSMPLQVCVNSRTIGCVLKTAEGTAITVSSFGVSNCVNISLSEPLDHGFCCKDFSNCLGLENLHSSSPVVDHVRQLLESRSLLPRGPVVDHLLHLIFLGVGDLFGSYYVHTTLAQYDVVEYVDYEVEQICILPKAEVSVPYLPLVWLVLKTS